MPTADGRWFSESRRNESDPIGVPVFRDKIRGGLVGGFVKSQVVTPSD